MATTRTRNEDYTAILRKPLNSILKSPCMDDVVVKLLNEEPIHCLSVLDDRIVDRSVERSSNDVEIDGGKTEDCWERVWREYTRHDSSVQPWYSIHLHRVAGSPHAPPHYSGRAYVCAYVPFYRVTTK